MSLPGNKKAFLQSALSNRLEKREQSSYCLTPSMVLLKPEGSVCSPCFLFPVKHLPWTPGRTQSRKDPTI